jgi:4-hydroxy-3-polyprenylbenzoate decarboxylase
LDHSSDSFSYGGKLGIDGTIKHPEERESFGEPFNTGIPQPSETHEIPEKINKFISDSGGMLFIPDLSGQVMIISINQELHPSGLQGIRDLLTEALPESFRLILLVDNTVDIKDMNMVAWQILGNSDPGRDAISISERAILINGTMKAFGKVRFKRRWPNVVSSLPETIRKIDEKWELLGIGPFITSPSFKISRLIRNGKDQVVSGQA